MIVVVMIMATISSDILSPPVDGLLPNSGQMDFPKPHEGHGEKVVARSFSGPLPFVKLPADFVQRQFNIRRSC